MHTRAPFQALLVPLVAKHVVVIITRRVVPRSPLLLEVGPLQIAAALLWRGAEKLVRCKFTSAVGKWVRSSSMFLPQRRPQPDAMSPGLRQPSGTARSGNFAASPPANISSPYWTKSPAEKYSHVLSFQGRTDGISDSTPSGDLEETLQGDNTVPEGTLESLRKTVHSVHQKLDHQEDVQDLREKIEDLLRQVSQLESVIASMEEDAMTQTQALMDQQSLTKQLEAEKDQLWNKLTQVHEQATEKVNRANFMLQERDAQIQQLKLMAEERQGQSNLLGIMKSLEDQVQVLEAELKAKREIDSNEEPVLIKSESRKVQRAAVLPSPAAVDADRLRQLEAELQQAKIEFEKLLARQAEEMTMEFERMFQKQAHITGEVEVKQDVEQLRADLAEKTNTCNSLKLLIEQQDEVMAEQRKVLEAQTSSSTVAVDNMQKMLKEAQQMLKNNIFSMQSKDAEIAALQETVRAMAEASSRAPSEQRKKQVDERVSAQNFQHYQQVILTKSTKTQGLSDPGARGS